MLLGSALRNFINASKSLPLTGFRSNRNYLHHYCVFRRISRNVPASVFRQLRSIQTSTAAWDGGKVKKSGRKKMPVLTEQERKELLEPLLQKEWTVQENRDAIYKEFKFKDFKQAFKFMTAVGEKADEMDHHPEWFNVYNKVNITLSSHDCNGLSKRDIKLANIIEESAANVK